MKTVCVYHSIDLDGWMSAAIVKHWWQKQQISYIQEGNRITNPNTGEDSIDFIGYNYGEPILDLSEYDKVIMVDISFSKEELLKLNNPNDRLIWIDHHASALREFYESFDTFEATNKFFKGLRSSKFAACELTWKYFFPNQSMPEIVRLLGRYDCFGHKFTKEDQDRLDILLDVKDNSATEQLHPYADELNCLLKKKGEEVQVLEFQYSARQCISNYEEAYKYLVESLEPTSAIIEEMRYNGASIYQYLCVEAKQVYKNGFPIYFDRNISITDTTGTSVIPGQYKFICINRERFNPINFGIDYHEEGYDGCACFHYDGVTKLWRFSLYNDNGEVDCSVIAKQYGGGGHKGASGFVTTDLNKIF